MPSFVQYGLGPIGCAIARLAIERGFKLRGAVDVNPQKVGKDAGEIIGVERKNIVVSNNAKSTLEKAKPDFVFHATSSSVQKVFGQLQECLSAKANVVSTCEELAFPVGENKALAKRLDEVAKENNVCILGTGVNPGFVLDSFILACTAACQKVESISATRELDASKRRLPFQQKVGVGLTLAEFDEKVKRGEIRHVGLRESSEMIAVGLGWKITRYEEKIEPVVDGQKVAGTKQVAKAFEADLERIRLEIIMAAGAKSPKDEIVIEGAPPLHIIVEEGIHGDVATPAVVVNAALCLKGAGLKTMKDLPLPHCAQGV